jgi:hypothetical protein
VRKRLCAGSGLGVLGLLAMAVFCAWPPPHHAITQTNFEKLRKGMTQGQVEAILEAPPGDYTTRPPALVARPVCDMVLPGQHGGEPIVWQADSLQVYIWFDGEDRAEYMESNDWPRDNRTILDRVRWWWWRRTNGL